MPVRTCLLAAASLLSLCSAASARDRTPYVGVEGGFMKPNNLNLDYRLGLLDVDDGLALEHKTGFDADVIAGYDLGLLRIEGELGWKRASLEDVSVRPAVFTTTARPAIDGRTRVLSAMANLLLDFGSDDAFQVYGGAGVGLARFDVDSDITGPGVPVGSGVRGDDRSTAWQLLAGIRVPVSDNLDLGLKYRFFNSKIGFRDNSDVLDERLNGRFRSHSLLASLVFNLGSRVEPVAAPVEVATPPVAVAPPPATQTCPDGSVILATDACPLPAAPPPPPAAPERG